MNFVDDILGPAVILGVMLLGLAALADKYRHPARRFIPAALIFYGVWFGGGLVLVFSMMFVFFFFEGGVPPGITPAIAAVIIVFLPMFAAKKVVARPPRNFEPAEAGTEESADTDRPET